MKYNRCYPGFGVQCILVVRLPWVFKIMDILIDVICFKIIMFKS